jgi:glycosyltransferase involved in cell wall biosynthesis
MPTLTKKIMTRISIGMPVYNDENTIGRAIESILHQTFSDFELIISDNNSTDNTGKICEEYKNKDNRIRYVKQKENIGLWQNFYFLLKSAKSEYFMWTPADDVWLPYFIEKNITTLDTNANFIASNSKFLNVDEDLKVLETQDRTNYKKQLLGKSYDYRARFYLWKVKNANNLLSIFRTKYLKQSIVEKISVDIEKMIFLNILQFGEINVIDEFLMLKVSGGDSKTSTSYERAKMYNDYGFVGNIFPLLPFTIWTIQNHGFLFFIKNMDFYFFHNCSYLGYVLKHVAKKKNIVFLEKILSKISNRV